MNGEFFILGCVSFSLVSDRIWPLPLAESEVQKTKGKYTGSASIERDNLVIFSQVFFTLPSHTGDLDIMQCSLGCLQFAKSMVLFCFRLLSLFPSKGMDTPLHVTFPVYVLMGRKK